MSIDCEAALVKSRLACMRSNAVMLAGCTLVLLQLRPDKEALLLNILAKVLGCGRGWTLCCLTWLEFILLGELGIMRIDGQRCERLSGQLAYCGSGAEQPVDVLLLRLWHGKTSRLHVGCSLRLNANCGNTCFAPSCVVPT